MTGLRFIAAAAIVWHHAPANFGLPEPVPYLVNGVSFFFILSGFILAYRYPHFANRHEVQNYLIARVSRIWPLHLATLILTTIAIGIPFDMAWITNAILLQSWVPLQAYYYSGDPVSWSISAEIFFYVAFPLIIYRWHKYFYYPIYSSILLGLICIYVVHLYQLPILSESTPSATALLYINPAARLLEFVMGIATCSIWQAVSRINLERLGHLGWTAAEVGSILATLFLFQIPLPFGSATLWFENLVSLPGFGLIIIVFATQRGALSKLLSTDLAVLLGEISFAIYLLHIILIWWYLETWATIRPTPDYMALTLFVIGTLALSWASWRLIEIPCRDAIRGRHTALDSTSKLAAPLAVALLCCSIWAALSIAFATRDFAVVETTENRPVPVRGLCSFDGIQRPTNSNLLVQERRIMGWAVDPATQSAPTPVRFLLVDETRDTAFRIEATRHDTPSLVANLGNAAYGRAGVSARINALMVPAGNFTVYIEQMSADGWVSCRAPNALRSSVLRDLSVAAP